MKSFSFRFVKYCGKFSESETVVDNVNGRVDMRQKWKETNRRINFAVMKMRILGGE